MNPTIRLGMLTPSSNTTLEPVTTAMLAGLPQVSAHFSRFRVTEIALTGDALAQFDDRPILAAAELLAHAKVDVIAWNGTSSAWLGFCRRSPALPAHRGGDRHQGDHLDAGTERDPCRDRSAAPRPRDPLYRRRAATHHRQLRDAGHHLRCRTASGHPGQFRLRRSIRRHPGPDDPQPWRPADRTPSRWSAPTFGPRLWSPRWSRKSASRSTTTIATAVWKSLRLAGVDPARITGWGQVFKV